MRYKQRIEGLQQRLRRKKIDGLLVTEPHNRRYLSGYTAVDHNISESSGALLIPASGKGVLLTDFRYQIQAEREVEELELDVQLYKRGLTALLTTILPQHDIRSLAFESDYLLHSSYQALKEALDKPGVRLVPVSGIIEKMRLIKDHEELHLLRQSVALNEEVFQEIYQSLGQAQSEIELALAIQQIARQKGCEGLSFESIVASGDNSALPHAVPTDSPILKNRPLTIDMGLVLHGYCSDMTRTFVPGTADSRYKTLHRIVRQAQLAGMEAIKPGVTAREVDKAARQVISDAGYGDNFGHSLGHGVGLAVHEAPRLSARSRQKLRPGMVVTVEPGIYIPDWGGIRLENMCIVTDDGYENLNSDMTWLDL